MKIRWAKSDQHHPPTMTLFRVGQVVDTADIGVSDETAAAWIADGYATRVLEVGDPEPVEGEALEADPVAMKPIRVRKTRKATEEA